MNKKVHELLAPAGNYEKAFFALKYGADAIFIGAKSYSLRARASNFEIEEIAKITKYAHKIKKKVYVVLNIFCHNVHLKNFESFFKKINACKVDGIICADPFIISKIHKINPKMEIHISTQQSITNSKAALFWKKNFAKRVVLAREVDFNNLKLLINNLGNKLETEYFIHGAVCISYSGRCTMSNNFSFRNANIGGCAHSCRWKYKIINCPDVKDYFTMSAKDMNLSVKINQLLNLNINSFKIEGRMKSLHYIATVVLAYKKLIEEYKILKKINFKHIEEIKKAENRETDTACFDGKPNYKKMLYFDKEKKALQNFSFIIKKKLKYNEYLITLKNKIKELDKFELISFQNNISIFKIIKIFELDKQVEVANKPMKDYIIQIQGDCKLKKFDLARKIII